MKLNNIFLSINNLNSSLIFCFHSTLIKDTFYRFKIKKNLLIYNLNIQLDLLFDLLSIFFYPHKEKNFKFAISTDTQTIN